MAWGTGSWGTRGWGADSPTPVPAQGPVVGIQTVPIAELRKLWGRDLYWDEDYRVSPAGDWLVVEREEALKQSVRRRILTSPGEWQTKPDYGIGAADFVKMRKTPAVVAELTERITTQLSRDQRIESVDRVDVEDSTNESLHISVKIVPRAQAKRAEPLVVDVEVS